MQSLTEMRNLFSKEDINKLMSYDPDRLFFHLFTRNSRIENQVLLGSKAFFLKRMHQYEFPIPPGFVITTDLYRNRDIINTHPDISSEFDALLWDNLRKMENYTGLGFGDPQKPLLFSVRSGAPMSLPGAMDTFLNIGLTDEITLKLSQRPNYGWTAWDCYRRLIQSWGMAHGISRDEFDQVMILYKQRYEIKQKFQFSPIQMQEMVNDYKKVLDIHSVTLEQDPYRQLYKSISHVLDSWNTPRARLYRSKLHIAEEWGTAVIIQKMVWETSHWIAAPACCLLMQNGTKSQGYISMVISHCAVREKMLWPDWFTLCRFRKPSACKARVRCLWKRIFLRYTRRYCAMPDS
jgi:pyruvate,orthophosphate dikinase